MAYDRSLPGFPEIGDWPVLLSEPVRIRSHGYCRSGSYDVDLEDAAGVRHPFFFDRSLGRLCYGTRDDTDDAAFLKRGSRLQREAFALLESLAGQSSEFVELRECLERARTWVPLSEPD